MEVVAETLIKYELNGSSCDGYNAYQTGKHLQQYLGVWVVSFLAIIGILLNAICIYALCSKMAPKNLFNMLLLNLLSWDTIFLILHICRRMTHLEENKAHACSDGMNKILIPLWNIALAQSVFATLLLSIERHICINYENIYSKYINDETSRWKLCVKCIVPVTTLVFLLHIPEFIAPNTEVKISLKTKPERRSLNSTFCHQMSLTAQKLCKSYN